MRIVLRWVINAVVLLLIAYIVPGIVVVSWYSALITSLVFGLVNAVVRPVLLLLTLPVTIVTLGLFVLVVNGLLFWFVASVVDGFSVASFGAAFIGALLLSLSSWATGMLLSEAE